MRFGVSGPRILGFRPWVSFPVGGGRRPSQGAPGPQIEGSFVYVVRGDHNLAKIGVTTNPRARLAQLRTGSAFPIDYAFIGATRGSGYDIEQAAHAMLSHHRANGEWFDVSPEVALSALMAAAGRLGHPVQSVDLETADRVLSIAATGEDAGGGLMTALVFLASSAVMTVNAYIFLSSIGFEQDSLMFGFVGAWVVFAALIWGGSKTLPN